MTNEIKTWKERAIDYASTNNQMPDGPTCAGFYEAEIAELRAKVESLAADAERYRHLRRPEFGNLLYCSVVAGECGENLDRVVDEDMAKEKA